jgi:predicted MFS family arabinose efflux permease
LFLVLREPKDTQGGAAVGAVAHATSRSAGYGHVLKNKNIVLCMLSLMCAMACIFVLGGMLPSYLTDYLKLTQQQMGFVTSALGFGGFFGQFGVPGISDKLGRRPTLALAFLGAAATVWVFMGVGPNPNVLFGTLFLLSFFSLGNVALITGPIATESAPAGLISSAIGIVVATGEIFGGGIAPSIGGAIAQSRGIENILWMPLIGVALGALVSFFIEETAPSKVRKTLVAVG